jgi:N-acetylmuramoyl-L-alanine amidase CwlA
MKIVQSILINNPCYTAGKKITVKGLMLHSVGCPQPSAQVFIKQWNRADYGRACVHALIDGNNGYVYQTLPWNHRGWHGGGSCNDTHIGVEMCEPACIRYTGGNTFTCNDLATARAVVQRTYDTAVALFTHLCKQYGLDPMTDIISHKEGGVRDVASKHADPEHLWNQLGMGYTMDTFRKAVKAAMGGVSTDMPYLVKITASTLNVRGGVGTNYPVTTTVRKGEIYTIVGEAVKGSTKWGKLKSGAGWISLKYTQRI